MSERAFSLIWRVVATSSAREVRPFCSAITKWPWACSIGITLLQPEPSAQNPWTKTMFAWFVVRADP